MVQVSKTSQRGNAFSLVLNDSGADLFKSSHHIKHKFQCASLPLVFVAVAFHTMDDREDGHGKKTAHYHVVLQFSQKFQVGSIIKIVVELFHCNANQVSCEKCTDVCAQTRYLCHLDDADKYPYDISIVEAYPVQTFEHYLDKVMKVLDIEDLINIVHRFPSTEKLMVVLGAKQYKEWRIYINDLLRYS